MSILLSFIVPVFNGEKTLEHCLNSIKNIDFPLHQFEIIVVDNNSNDETQAIAQKSPVTLVTEYKQGRSHARNKGASIARGEILAFIDCDCMIDSTWPAELLKLFKYDFIGAAQGAIIPSGISQNSLNQFRYRRVHNYTKGSFVVLDVLGSNFPVINSAAFMIRKNVFDKIGGYDPEISRTEDADLSQRIFLSGFGLAAAEKAKAYVFWNDGKWSSYIARAWSVGKAISEYQLKWSRSRFFSIMQYSVYYLKRFQELTFFSKHFIFDLIVYIIIENIQILSFLLSLISNKKNPASQIAQIYFTRVRINFNSIQFHSSPDFSIVLLINQVVLFNLKDKKIFLLNKVSRDLFIDLIENVDEINSSNPELENFLLQLQQVGFLRRPVHENME